MTRTKVILAVVFACALSGAPQGQQPQDQFPNYQHNSNYSPLTSITPDNVKNLTTAWTFNYGAGSSPAGNLGLDYRFEVQPLLIGGVMSGLDISLVRQMLGMIYEDVEGGIEHLNKINKTIQ